MTRQHFPEEDRQKPLRRNKGKKEYILEVFMSWFMEKPQWRIWGKYKDEKGLINAFKDVRFKGGFFSGDVPVRVTRPNGEQKVYEVIENHAKKIVEEYESNRSLRCEEDHIHMMEMGGLLGLA